MFKNTLRMGRFLVFSCLMAASISVPSVVANGTLIAAKHALEATGPASADACADAIAVAHTSAAKPQQTA